MDNKIIYIDVTNKTYKEIYFKDNKADGFKLIGNKKYQLTLNDVLMLGNLFVPKKSLAKIDKYLDYDVYYDPENNLKHYIKDNEENYLLFLEKNGSSIRMFSFIDDNHNKKSNNHKDKYKIMFKKGIIIADALAIMLCLNMVGRYYFPYLEYQDNDINTTIEQEYIVESRDVKQAKEYIYLSNNLNDEQKRFLYNEDLLDMVMPYYKDTAMETLIFNRLENLCVDYFPETEEPEVAGYYAGDNVLHIKSGCDDLALGHEMTHLLQNPLCTMHFFIESTADIIQREFFFEQYEGYVSEDKNLKLLINTIGPEPIWNYCFSGDFTNIDIILRSNLNEEEYKRIMELFNNQTLDENDNIELENLISSLYKNMYNEDIKDNRDVFDINGKLIDQIYFYNDRIPETNKVRLPDFSVPEEYISYKDVPVINITKEEALKLMNEGYLVQSSLNPTSHDYLLAFEASDVKTKEQIISFYLDNKQITMPEEEAIKKGYFVRQYKLIMDDRAIENLNYKIPESFETFKYPILKAPSYVMDLESNNIYFTIYSKTIKDRFPDQEISKSNAFVAFNKE